MGFRSILSRSFPKPKFHTSPAIEGANNTDKLKREVSTRNWEEFLKAFSSDPSILAFVRLFCNEVNFILIFVSSLLLLTHEIRTLHPVHFSLQCCMSVSHMRNQKCYKHIFTSEMELKNSQMKSMHRLP